MSKIFKFVCEYCDYIMAIYVAVWVVNTKHTIDDIYMRTL